MTAPQNKEIVQQLFKEGICKKNLNLLDQLIHPQYVNHGIPDAQPGPDGFKEIIQTFHEAFPDMDITIDNIIAEGDFVAIRGCWQATHQGQFMGVPATSVLSFLSSSVHCQQSSKQTKLANVIFLYIRID